MTKDLDKFEVDEQWRIFKHRIQLEQEEWLAGKLVHIPWNKNHLEAFADQLPVRCISIINIMMPADGNVTSGRLPDW